MKLKLNLMVAVLAAGVVWNLAGAVEPDEAAKRQAEVGLLAERVFKRCLGDKNTRIETCKSVLADGEKLLQKYGDTMPPAALYRYMLMRRTLYAAAERLYNDEPTAENRKKLVAYAKDVIALPVHDPAMWVGVRGFSPTAEVVSAGKTLALLNIYETPGAAPKDAVKHIRDMIAMFPEKPEVPGTIAFNQQATVYALQLAVKTGEKDLAKELGGLVANKCLDTKFALDTLTEAGHPVMFTGELTTLDGKKLTFPQDAKGKVVLLDFWATWCGPCRASLPHVKQLHEKYKNRDVWIIGVSCDAPYGQETAEQNKQKVKEFVATNGCVWTQTYSGQWPAIASKYGVSKLPTVFLLDQQGRIVSVTARGQEEKLIEQALATAASR